jgi:hypothetical protein
MTTTLGDDERSKLWNKIDKWHKARTAKDLRAIVETSANINVVVSSIADARARKARVLLRMIHFGIVETPGGARILAISDALDKEIAAEIAKLNEGKTNAE